MMALGNRFLLTKAKAFLGVIAILLAQTVSAAASNDSFTNRIVLAGTNLQFTVSFAGARANSGGGALLWWEWTAISNGIVEIKSTESITLDARMTIYRGLSAVPASADQIYFEELFRTASFVAKAGEVYLITVGGLAYQPQTEHLELSLYFAPGNDHFEDRFILPPNANELRGSMYGASYELYGGDHPSSGTAWWSWTPNISGYAAFQNVPLIDASNVWVSLAIWRASSLEELTNSNEIGYLSTMGSTYFPITAGQEYVIMISGGNRTNLTHRFSISTTTGPGFLTQPEDQVVAPGGAALFHAYTPEIPPTNVKWQFNGVEIPGVYGSTYPVFNVSATNVGLYRAVVRIGESTTLSRQASLNMSGEDTAQPLRILRYAEDPQAISFYVEGASEMFHILESSSDMVTWQPVDTQFLSNQWPPWPWLQTIPKPGMETLRFFAGSDTAAPGYRAFFRARRAGKFKDACKINLRRIHLAKEDYRIRHQLAPGSPLAEDEVNQYFSESLPPHCPEGGTYTYNLVATPPSCSLAADGHTL
jgi:hypothetical protein